MKMEKQKIRIGDLSKQLGIERFVIRFWEKAFDLGPRRSNGGQRYYTQKDAERFDTIKDLLYNKRLTIAGAKKILSQHNQSNNHHTKENTQPLLMQSSFIPATTNTKIHAKNLKNYQTTQLQRIRLQKELILLKKQLVKLYELL